MTSFRTAVETAASGVHKLLRTGGIPMHFFNFVVLAVADGLFGLYGSERWDKLLIVIVTPLLVPLSLICRMWLLWT